MSAIPHSPDPFDLLTAEEREELQQHVQERQLKKGELLFPESKAANAVFSLRSGKVKLLTTDGQGREQIVHLARPGDLMGYRAVLGGDTYSCAAVALETTTSWAIPKSIFLQLLERNASFSHAVIHLLTSELRRTEHQLAILARKPVRARLAEALLELADTYGYESDSQNLAVTLTREEIAALVGTATETVIRLLHDLQQEGAVKIEGRKLCLPNLEVLKRVAEE